MRRELVHPSEESFTVVIFAPDGQTLATADIYGVIRVWNPEAREFKHVFAREVKRDAEPPSVYALAFTPDGKTLVSGGDEPFVTLWDLVGDRELRRLYGHEAGVNAIVVGPDGKTLATGSGDGTVLIWEL